jgi:bifunctional N-acetylglucosamine-1-phosphate-uridyltransferase/glucosamine-1-phosphate-acetyltransferase GlmU-like protein
MNLTNASLFDLSSYAHASLFVATEYPWQALDRLESYMAKYPWPQIAWPQNPGPLPTTLILNGTKLIKAGGLFTIEFGDATKDKLRVFENGTLLAGASVLMAGAVLAGGPLSIGKGVLIESGAFIKGPVIIGDQSEIRQGAYLRGHCLVGARCVVGHVTEVKHAILLDDAKAGHFAYLGDSILGNKVNLGAGTKLANLRFTAGKVLVGTIDTGRRKFGAILGDRAQTGCNAVTCPGAVIGKASLILPNTTVNSGWHPSNSTIPKSQRSAARQG